MTYKDIFQVDVQDQAFASVKGYFAEVMIARARERAAVEQLRMATALRKSTEEAFKVALAATVGDDIRDDARTFLNETLPAGDVHRAALDGGSETADIGSN